MSQFLCACLLCRLATYCQILQTDLMSRYLRRGGCATRGYFWLENKSKNLNTFPTRHITTQTLPGAFKKCSNVRCIIACSELFVCLSIDINCIELTICQLQTPQHSQIVGGHCACWWLMLFNSLDEGVYDRCNYWKVTMFESRHASWSNNGFTVHDLIAKNSRPAPADLCSKCRQFACW